MSIYNRESQYINLLAQKAHTVKELSEKLFISEPTVRRDIIILQKKGLAVCKRGVVCLKTTSPDQRIPLFIRHLEQNEAKQSNSKSVSHRRRRCDGILWQRWTRCCATRRQGHFLRCFFLQLPNHKPLNSRNNFFRHNFCFSKMHRSFGSRVEGRRWQN